jgi:hypothetical protein
MKKDEIVAARSDGGVMEWKDKKDVSFISTSSDLLSGNWNCYIGFV